MAYRRRIYNVSDINPAKTEGNFGLENKDKEFLEFLKDLRKFERDYEKGLADNFKLKKVATKDLIKSGVNKQFHYDTKVKKSRADMDAKICQMGKYFLSKDVPFYHRYSATGNILENISDEEFEKKYEKQVEEELKIQGLSFGKDKERKKKKGKLKTDNFPAISISDFKRISISFAGTALIILVIFGALSFSGKGLGLKGKVMGESREGYGKLSSAIEGIKNQDFQSSTLDFESAYQSFSRVSRDLDSIGGTLVGFTKFVPVASKLSSGKNMAEAGKHIALAGKSLNSLMENFYSLKNPLDADNSDNISLLALFQSTEENLKAIKKELEETEKNLNDVKLDDLPNDKEGEFIALRNKLPDVIQGIDSFLNNSYIFTDLLGGNGPRKYLFLFQNNQEMRATGGFIGSYGILDINDGRIRKFFIDGIFNPDGQLKDKIVPPKPIQKMSAAWSLHDSNWFPNFPTSAEKAILFFEKTGGPTADGVITLTPDVMEKLLEITGPIEMPEYEVTIDANNFVEKTQYEVEFGYDKEENQPKKIISDLAPIVIDKISNSKDLKSISRVLGVLSSGLREKHILLYSRNKDIESIISTQGWGGAILNTSRDYVSVINTNINGYKTDGVIEESIEHLAQIQEDGSIIDTLTVVRMHNGGNTEYDWLNKVNADYMRVYVPLGSKLLEVEGQTREFNNPPIDYDALGFKRDGDVKKEEEDMIINEDTGTRTYEESGKTVFANWVYVSPEESVTIKYKYLLPFKVSLDDLNEPAVSYSLLAQKQSGSEKSKFNAAVTYPSGYNLEWKYPSDLDNSSGNLKFDTDLKTDKFIGAVFLSRTNLAPK
jgi:flagellin-like hook-associated protein FlgL